MRQPPFRAYPPKNDVYRYTVFQAHVQRLLDQPTTLISIDKIDENALEEGFRHLDQTCFVSERQPTQETLGELLIANHQRRYWIAGYIDEDKIAALLKAAYDGVRSSDYIPFWVDCCHEVAVDDRNLRTAARIHGQIAQTLGIQPERVEEILRYSPPILFFFDLSQVNPEMKSDLALALVSFIGACQKEGYPPHQFVISDKDFRALESSMIEGEFYEFQPRLEAILEREPSRLKEALEKVKETQSGPKNIVQFLSPLKPKCLRPEQKRAIIEGLRTMANYRREPAVENRTRELLIEVARDRTHFDETLRRRAVEALSDVASGHIAPVIGTLLACLTDSATHVRCEAAVGLGKLGTRNLLDEDIETTLDALLKALPSPVPSAERTFTGDVLLSLGQVGRLTPSRRNDVLQTLLSYKDAIDLKIKESLLSALGELGVATRQTVAVLTAALQSGEPDWFERAKAAFNQLDTADEEGIAALVDASRSAPPYVQECAQRALRRLGYKA